MASRKSIGTSNSNCGVHSAFQISLYMGLASYHTHLGPCTKKLGMQSELHRKKVYQSVELLLLVPMLFLLAIPKCLLTLMENVYYTSNILLPIEFCVLLAHDAGHLWPISVQSKKCMKTCGHA